MSWSDPSDLTKFTVPPAAQPCFILSRKGNSKFTSMSEDDELFWSADIVDYSGISECEGSSYTESTGSLRDAIGADSDILDTNNSIPASDLENLDKGNLSASPAIPGPVDNREPSEIRLDRDELVLIIGQSLESLGLKYQAWLPSIHCCYLFE